MSSSSRPTTTSGCSRMTTAADLDQHFADAAGGLPGGPPRPDPAAPLRPGSGLTGARRWRFSTPRPESRQLDFAAR